MTWPFPVPYSETLSLGLVVAAVVVGVAVLYGVLSLLAAPFRRDEDDGPTLVEAADAVRPPRGALAHTDRGFDRMVIGTMFGLSTQRAIEILLLVGAVFALGIFLLLGSWLYAVAAFLGGVFLTAAVFVVFRDRRRAAVQDQLPDACFQLARSLRAGLGLPAAVRMTSSYSLEPLSGVLRWVAGRLDLGASPGVVFERAAEDVRLTDFDVFASAVTVHADVGGNLPSILDKLATMTRDRNQFRGYFKSVTALSRLSAVFIALTAPIALAYYAITKPELFMNFFTSTLGTTLLTTAAVMWVAGVVWVAYLLSRGDEN